MRRLVLFFLVAILLVLPLGFRGNQASAQGTPEPPSADMLTCLPGRDPTDEEAAELMATDDNEYLAWEGVCKPIPVGEPIQSGQVGDLDLPEALKETMRAKLDENQELVFQRYDVVFKEKYAATRPIRFSTDDRGAEFMAVVIRQASFVLDLLDEEQNDGKQALVSTQGNGFPIMEPWSMEIDMPHYQATEQVLETEGNLCLQDCIVSPGQPVTMFETDYAVIDSDTVCILCLLNDIADENEIFGRLEVYALMAPEVIPDGFSWIQSWDRVPDQPQPEARTTDPPTRFAWGYFKTGCKDS